MLIPSQITFCGGPAQLTTQQSTSCRREDEWRYSNGSQQRWQMPTVADDNNTCDWAADCDGEGRERAVRDGGDSGVVMMAVAAEDGSSGQQRRRRTTLAADDNGMRRDWAADYKGDGQERAARDGGDTEWR
jgi:hypothetical protein